MAELDHQERKLKGVSAASSAFSAISELFRAPTPERIYVQPKKEEEPASSSFKDHQVRPLDRIIGHNGLLRGFRILIVLTGLIFFVFVKINSMLSEIPVVVEKRTVVKVSEALGVQANAAQVGAVLVSPSRAALKQNAHAGVEAEVVKSVVEDGTNALKSEVERLRQQVEKYKGLYEAVSRTSATSVEQVSSEPVAASTETMESLGIVRPEETTEDVGVVREEEVQAPRMLREVGAVGVPSERI